MPRPPRKFKIEKSKTAKAIIATYKETGDNDDLGPNKGRLKKRSLATAHDYICDGRPTPLNVMVENMRFAYEEACKATDQYRQLMLSGADMESVMSAMRDALNWRKCSQDWAVDAAPYMHPKLAVVEVGAGETLPFKLSEVRRIIVDPKKEDAECV